MILRPFNSISAIPGRWENNERLCAKNFFNGARTRDEWIDGQMGDLRFYVLFNSILVISGRWLKDSKRMCIMEPRLRLERFPPLRGSTPEPLDQS